MSRSIQLWFLAGGMTLVDLVVFILSGLGIEPLDHVRTVCRNGRLGRLAAGSVARRDSRSRPAPESRPSSASLLSLPVHDEGSNPNV